MAQRKIIDEKPAYTVYEGKNYYADGDLIAVPYESINHGTMMRFYILGSVVGYAIQHGECPFESVEDSKKRGHELHFAFPKTSMLTRHAQDRFWGFHQPIGSVITFHGKQFEIRSAANNNITLRQVELADA